MKIKEIVRGMVDQTETCPECGEARFKEIGVCDDITGESINLQVRVACECEIEKAKAKEERFNRMQEERRIRRTRQRCLPDDRLHAFTFDKDDAPDTQASKTCRKYVDRWERVTEKGYGLLIYGTVGTGKTFYAACIVNALIDKGIAAELTTITRILNTVAIEDRDAELAKLNRLPLIVIDDLGAERPTDYSRELAFTIIDERVKAGRPMVVTTNLTVAEMRSTSETALLRIYERVLEACPIRVGLTGKSRRLANDKENVENAMRDLFGG